MTGHRDTESGVAVFRDGTRFVSASHDNSVKNWDATSGVFTITETIYSTKERVFLRLEIVVIVVTKKVFLRGRAFALSTLRTTPRCCQTRRDSRPKTPGRRS